MPKKSWNESLLIYIRYIPLAYFKINLIKFSPRTTHVLALKYAIYFFQFHSSILFLSRIVHLSKICRSAAKATLTKLSPESFCKYSDCLFRTIFGCQVLKKNKQVKVWNDCQVAKNCAHNTQDTINLINSLPSQVMSPDLILSSTSHFHWWRHRSWRIFILQINEEPDLIFNHMRWGFN